MDKEFIQPLLARIANSAFAALGGYLGFTGSDQTKFVGAGMVFASLGWEWWQARGQQKMIAILAKMHPVAPLSASTAEAAKAGVQAAKTEMSR